MLYECLALLLLLMPVAGSNQLAVLHLESVEYPLLAWQARIQGDVRVTMHVDSDGKVLSAIASSGDKLLQQAAIDNLKTWIFVTNREFDLEISYQFRLEKPESSSQHATRMVIDLPAHRVMVICNLPKSNS